MVKNTSKVVDGIPDHERKFWRRKRYLGVVDEDVLRLRVVLFSEIVGPGSSWKNRATRA
jgi:hypothetical protein